MKRTVLTIALAALLLVPALSLAQEEQTTTYIWINFLKANPDQGDALVKFLIEEDSKFFNPLVDSGKAYDWGVAMPVIHDDAVPFSHIEWVSFVGWDGVDAFMGRFMETQQARSDEEKAAVMEKAKMTVVEGSHSDAIYRILELGSGTRRPGYINLGYYTAKPGKSDDAKEFYADVAMPVYEKLQADGTVNSFGLASPAVHRGGDHTHMGWFTTDNLAARDAVYAAFDAAEEARSEEENKAIGERWQEAFDPEGHSDQILLVLHHYAGAEGGE